MQYITLTVTDPVEGLVEDNVQYNEQKDGTLLKTAVHYDAKTMRCSVIVPAVLSVEKGDNNAEFKVSY